MSQEKPIQLGVTPPISTEPSTEREIKLTNDLLETLKSYGLFESEQEAQKR
jgi:poly(A) polymerase